MFSYLPELANTLHYFSQLTNLIIMNSQHAILFPQLPDLNVIGSQPALLFPLLIPSGHIIIVSQYVSVS